MVTFQDNSTTIVESAPALTHIESKSYSLTGSTIPDGNASKENPRNIFHFRCDSEERDNTFRLLESTYVVEEYQAISRSNTGLEGSQTSLLSSNFTSSLTSESISGSIADDNEPISRGRYRTRASFDSTPSENLFDSQSRASSTNTDGVTERSESVFSPPKVQHRRWSRNCSPSLIDNNLTYQQPIITQQKIQEQADENRSNNNLVPCLQCFNAGLRCSFSIPRIKDRTCCTRCWTKDDDICIVRIYTGIDSKGERKYDFQTNLEKYEKKEFEQRLHLALEKQWMRSRFALPMLKPGYRNSLRNWRETSRETEQRMKDCHFVVT